MNMQRFTASDAYAVAAPRSAETVIAEGAYVAFLLIIFVGLSPFAARDAEAIASYPDNGGGDALRQICYLGSFAVIAGMAFMKRGLQALSALPVLMIVLLGWCMASALWSDQPDVTFRRAVLVAIVICSALMSVDTVGTERSLKLWCYVLVGILIVNCIASPILPQAVHLPGDPEPDIIGDWRGIYFHKNIAGSVTATSAILFLYYALTTRRTIYMALCAVALGFLLMTVSKSSLGLLPAALIMGVAYRFTIGRGLERIIALVAALLLAVLACAALIAWWDTIAFMLQDPKEFTGRTAIWSAELGFIRDHPLLGSGFGSFAETGDRSPVYNYMGAAWVGTVAQGHHGYLELLVTIGGIGFALAMAALLIEPAIAFLRYDRADPGVKTLAFTLFAFFIMHNFMESDFLARDAPTWVTYLLAIGLLRTGQREAEAIYMRASGVPSWARL